MQNNLKPQKKLSHILCPSDLSPKSQKALGFAARIAAKLDAKLPACHCAPAPWFASYAELPQSEENEIKAAFRDCIGACQAATSKLQWQSVVIRDSFDPARDILTLAAKTAADLIVMKARPGILSAFHFGSIVERVVTSSPCPVLILPSRFLAERDPAEDVLQFRRILFDHDFSGVTGELFEVANTLSRDYDAELHTLSVLEVPAFAANDTEVSFSRTAFQTAVRGHLDKTVRSNSEATAVKTSVEWGRHVDKVLEYAVDHDIDLICTALAPPNFYLERLYSAYLGSLLRSTPCPILLRQAV